MALHVKQLSSSLYLRRNRVLNFACSIHQTQNLPSKNDPEENKNTSSNDRGNRQKMLDRMIRVDHAGEYGADRIYAGQMAVLGKTHIGPVINHMWEQEKHHLDTFNKLIPKHRVRPTALLPVWHLAGFALGAGTALLGKEGAMACTVAVESVIGEHYDQQIRELMRDNPDVHKELISIISQFRDEELDHHDTGLEHDAEKAPFYKALTEVIKVGCRGAIWVAEKV